MTCMINATVFLLHDVRIQHIGQFDSTIYAYVYVIKEHEYYAHEVCDT
jgi:hypothetical protein